MNINYFLHGQRCLNHFLGTTDGQTDAQPHPESETDGRSPPQPGTERITPLEGTPAPWGPPSLSPPSPAQLPRRVTPVPRKPGRILGGRGMSFRAPRGALRGLES